MEDPCFKPALKARPRLIPRNVSAPHYLGQTTTSDEMPDLLNLESSELRGIMPRESAHELVRSCGRGLEPDLSNLARLHECDDSEYPVIAREYIATIWMAASIPRHLVFGAKIHKDPVVLEHARTVV